MTVCANCANAIAMPLWAGFNAACLECIARHVARSPQAFDALSPRGNKRGQPLLDLIATELPQKPMAEAKAMVWRWWKREQQRAVA